jgi:hypothetical protein
MPAGDNHQQFRYFLRPSPDGEARLRLKGEVDPFRLFATVHRTRAPCRKRPLSLAYAVGTPDERTALDVHEWVLSDCPCLGIGVAIVFGRSGRIFTGRNYLTY